jgi:tetratricopeptide (TPR) repeat protein
MAKKRLNKKLVLVLTLLASITMIALAVVMLTKLERTDPARFVALAKAAESDEDWDNAAVFYHKAWERSGDAAHLVAQGQTLLNKGDIVAALRSWQNALVSQPDLISAHTHQLTLLFELGRLYGNVRDWFRVKEAAQKLVNLEADKSPAEAAFAHHAYGLALVNLESQDASYAAQGLVELEKAVSLAPEIVDYAIELADRYIEQGRADEGEDIFGELFEAHAAPGPAASKVRLAYARRLARRGQYEQAELNFKESLRFAADDAAAQAEAKLGYAVFLSQQWARAARGGLENASAKKLFGEAEAIVKESIEADPDDFDAPLQAAVLYQAAGRYEDVLNVCEARLQRGFTREGVEGARNRLHTFTLSILASEACAALSLEADDVAEREKRLSDAELYLTDAKGEYPSHPRVFSQAGRIALAQGRDRAALEAYRRADDAYRVYNQVNWEDKMRLAGLHLKLSEPGAAKAVLEEVIGQARTQRAGDSAFWLLYAQVLLSNNELDGALATANRILVVDPTNNAAKRIKAAVFERIGEPGRAGVLTGPGAIRNILEAKQLAMDGDIERAISVLREALDEDPANFRLVSTLVSELLSLDRAEEARAVLDRARQADPESAQLQALTVWVRPDLSPDQRDRALLEIIETEEDAYRRALDLIAFYVRRNDPEKALGHINEAEQLLIDKATPFAQNATIAHHRTLLKEKLRTGALLGNDEVMQQARDAAAKFDVDGVGGQSLLGLYHLYREESEQAVTAFQASVEAQPTDARSLAHMGQCLQILERTDEAQTAYERAVRINPSEALAHIGLGQLAQLRGDKEAYERELSVCRRLMPAHPWVREGLLARREQADPVAAIARREALLQETPDDYDNLRRLANLCETVNDLQRADKYYEELLTLRPDDKTLHVAASKYYRRTDRPEKSLELVANYAASRSTKEEQANARILIASHYLGEGELDLVETTLLEAVDLAETPEVVQSLAEFYLHSATRAKEALRWYDRAVELAEEKQAAQLPQILASRITCLLNRHINDLERARICVDDLLARVPDNPRGLLLDSEVHARMGDIEEAVASLSKYLIQAPKDALALFQRAQHYVAMGRTTAAIQDLETVKRSNPLALELRPRILLARLHFQSGRKDAWINELETLVEGAPDSAVALEELARAYIHEQRLNEADRIVTAQINRAADKPDARWFRLRGWISSELNDHDKALADLKRSAELDGFSAESLTAVLDAYHKVERFADGVAYYEQRGSRAQRTASLLSRYALLLALDGQEARAVEEFRNSMRLATAEASGAVGVVVRDLLQAFGLERAVGLFEGKPGEGPAFRANQRILIRLHRLAKRYDDAAALIDEMLRTTQVDGERAQLLEERGDIHNLAGRPEQARQAYEEALKYDDTNWILLNNLAYLLSDDLGEYGLARPYAERAVALRETTHTLDTLGWIYVGLGDYRRAIAELNRAIRLGPDSAVSYYHLGEAYRCNGQFTEASNILRSGKDVARAAGDTGLIAQIEASSQKASNRDHTP